MVGLVAGAAPIAAQAGSAPALRWTPQTASESPPPTYDFGAVSASGASRTFTLKNSGGSATSALKVSLSTTASGFSIRADHCSALSIGPRKTCTVRIHYTPTGATSDQAALTAISKKPAATGSISLRGKSATPPVITSSDHTTFAVGSAGSFTVTTTPGTPSTTTITETGSLPSGVTFTDNGDGTATLAGTPAAGTGGPHSLTITASNGVLPNATQSFTLTVLGSP